MTFKGVSGTLRVGYQTAATLGGWEMSPKAPHVFAFTARTTSVDEYWLTQEPLDLRLDVGRTEWLWRNVRVDQGDGKVFIELRDKPVVDRPVTV